MKKVAIIAGVLIVIGIIVFFVVDHQKTSEAKALELQSKISKEKSRLEKELEYMKKNFIKKNVAQTIPGAQVSNAHPVTGQAS